MDKTGKNLDDLQDINRGFIIRYLATHEGCSRAELAKASGLKQATITKIMRALMESGVVSETGFSEGLKGRRSIGLRLNYSGYLVAGVKLAWERLSIGLFDLGGRAYGEIFSHSFPRLDRERADEVVRLTAERIDRLRSDHPNLIAVGIAVPGPFHRGEGAVYINDDSGGGRSYYPFLGNLRQRIDLPLVMDHDANAGALAYWWFRSDCDTRIALLYLLASEGIGGGVVSKGQIFTGQRGHSAEIGHIVVERGGHDCVCGGKGCLDAYASTLAVERLAEEQLPAHPESLLAKQPRVDFTTILGAMESGDEFATGLIRAAGVHIGYGFASLIPVFDPDVIVIGDLMAGGGRVLLEGIDDGLMRTLSPFYRKPEIVLANPGDDLVLLGAATIAIDYVFKRPTELLMAGTENAGHETGG